MFGLYTLENKVNDVIEITWRGPVFLFYPSATFDKFWTMKYEPTFTQRAKNRK